MAQTGFTPLQIYSSTTAAAAPAVGNLTNSTLGSELAINITDGKLFYKDNANAIQVIAWKTTPTTAGGTGLTSYTAGDLLYYATGTTLSKLAIGASGRWLGSSGSAPQWNAPAALTKTDDTNVTLTLGGSASTSLLNAASLTLGWTGQLSVARGGTGNATGAATAVISNATTGLMQITGPGTGTTRVMTIPDANFTAARTDAAQTFTGDQSITDKVYVGGATAYGGSQVIVGSGRIQSNNNTYGYVGPYGITSINSGSNGTVSQSGGGLTLVQGGISFNNFWDLVIWQYAGNAVVISSATYGSPSSRSYSVSSGNLVLAITNNNNTGNYSISVTNIGN